MEHVGASPNGTGVYQCLQSRPDGLRGRGEYDLDGFGGEAIGSLSPAPSEHSGSPIGSEHASVQDQADEYSFVSRLESGSKFPCVAADA